MTEENKDNVVPENEFARRRQVGLLVDQLMSWLGNAGRTFGDLRDLGVSPTDMLDLIALRVPHDGDGYQRELMKVLTEGTSRVFVPLLAQLLYNKATRGTYDIPDVLQMAAKIDSVPEFMIPALHVILGNLERPEGSMPPMPPFPMPPPFPFDGARDRDDDLVELTPSTDNDIAAARMRRTLDRLFEEAAQERETKGLGLPNQAPALQCHVMLRPGHTLEGVLSKTQEGGLRLLTPTSIDVPSTLPHGPRTIKKQVLAEQFFDYADVVTVALQRDIEATEGSRIIS